MVVVLTSAEGLYALNGDKRRRAEKEKERVEKGEYERKRKAREVAREVAEPSGIFPGAPSAETKVELEDLAAALKIPFNGTKYEVGTRI